MSTNRNRQDLEEDPEEDPEELLLALVSERERKAVETAGVHPDRGTLEELVSHPDQAPAGLYGHLLLCTSCRAQVRALGRHDDGEAPTPAQAVSFSESTPPAAAATPVNPLAARLKELQEHFRRRTAAPARKVAKPLRAQPLAEAELDGWTWTLPDKSFTYVVRFFEAEDAIQFWFYCPEPSRAGSRIRVTLGDFSEVVMLEAEPAPCQEVSANLRIRTSARALDLSTFTLEPA